RGRIGRREIPNPAEERRLPHLDGDRERFVEREKHWDGQQDRQTARCRVHLLGLIKLQHFLLLTLGIGGVTLLHFLHLRLQRAHLRHRFRRLIDERKQEELDHYRRQEDGDAEIECDAHRGQPARQRVQ